MILNEKILQTLNYLIICLTFSNEILIKQFQKNVDKFYIKFKLD